MVDWIMRKLGSLWTRDSFSRFSVRVEDYLRFSYLQYSSMVIFIHSPFHKSFCQLSRSNMDRNKISPYIIFLAMECLYFGDTVRSKNMLAAKVPGRESNLVRLPGVPFWVMKESFCSLLLEIQYYLGSGSDLRYRSLRNKSSLRKPCPHEENNTSSSRKGLGIIQRFCNILDTFCLNYMYM